MRALLLATTLLFATTAIAADDPVTHRDITQMPAGEYALDPDHASAYFAITHLGFSHYHGRFDHIDATLNLNPADLKKSTVTATIYPASVDTHNSTLDAELAGKNFFNADAFPTITFTSDKIDVVSKNHGKIHGTLTLLGVSKPVVFDTIFNGAGTDPFGHTEKVGFSADLHIKRSDYGMTAYLPAVGDDVDLHIEAEFSKS